jgi:hypothetical protein
MPLNNLNLKQSLKGSPIKLPFPLPHLIRIVFIEISLTSLYIFVCLLKL